MNAIFADFGSAAVPAEISFLSQNACPEMSDPEGCRTAVESWWEPMAKVIFNEVTASWVCNTINQECKVPELR